MQSRPTALYQQSALLVCASVLPRIRRVRPRPVVARHHVQNRAWQLACPVPGTLEGHCALHRITSRREANASRVSWRVQTVPSHTNPHAAALQILLADAVIICVFSGSWAPTARTIMTGSCATCRRTGVQCDEIWSFVGCKEKHAKPEDKATGERGDVWTFTALCAKTKLILSYRVGSRDADEASVFMEDVKDRLASRVQLTTDGAAFYLRAVD